MFLLTPYQFFLLCCLFMVRSRDHYYSPAKCVRTWHGCFNYDEPKTYISPGNRRLNSVMKKEVASVLVPVFSGIIYASKT
jgi:hypothetical protein